MEMTLLRNRVAFACATFHALFFQCSKENKEVERNAKRWPNVTMELLMGMFVWLILSQPCSFPSGYVEHAATHFSGWMAKLRPASALCTSATIVLARCAFSARILRSYAKANA